MAELIAILIGIGVFIIVVVSKNRRDDKSTVARPLPDPPAYPKPKDTTTYHQGNFVIANPEKYRGDPEAIKFRSNWEKRAFHYCDNTPKVIAWSSEEIIVPYYMKGRRGRQNYYPDLVIYFEDKTTVMVEIKPKSERDNPSYQNKCKWAAARKYCRHRNWRFSIWTEDTIQKLWRQDDYE